VSNPRLIGVMLILIFSFIIFGYLSGWLFSREIITYGGRCKRSNHHRYIRNNREYMCSRYDFREEDGSIDYDDFYYYHLNCKWHKI